MRNIMSTQKTVSPEALIHTAIQSNLNVCYEIESIEVEKDEDGTYAVTINIDFPRATFEAWEMDVAYLGSDAEWYQSVGAEKVADGANGAYQDMKAGIQDDDFLAHRIQREVSALGSIYEVAEEPVIGRLLFNFPATYYTPEHVTDWFENKRWA